MDTIFMNYENSRTSDHHRLLINLTDKIDLTRKDKYVVSSNLSIYYTWKKIHTKVINLKYQLQHGMKNLSNLMDHILYQIFKIILNMVLKQTRDSYQ